MNMETWKKRKNAKVRNVWTEKTIFFCLRNILFNHDCVCESCPPTNQCCSISWFGSFLTLLHHSLLLPWVYNKVAFFSFRLALSLTFTRSGMKLSFDVFFLNYKAAPHQATTLETHSKKECVQTSFTALCKTVINF